MSSPVYHRAAHEEQLAYKCSIIADSCASDACREVLTPAELLEFARRVARRRSLTETGTYNRPHRNMIPFTPIA